MQHQTQSLPWFLCHFGMETVSYKNTKIEVLIIYSIFAMRIFQF